MAILSKGIKPGNFEWHNSLKVSFTNIWGLPSNFVDCKSFLESNSPDIIAQCETNLDDSIDSGDLSVRVYFLLIQKDSTNSYAWFCCLCEGRTSFHAGIISGKLQILPSAFNWLYFIQCITSFLSIDHLNLYAAFWFYFI